MLGVLSFGFLIGMRHALEADHMAAVACLATRGRSLRQVVGMGAVWGLGHTLTLFVFGTVVLALDSVVPERLAGLLETAVGVMLVGLGLSVLWRLLRDRVHFHSHRHGAEQVHFHAHSHRGEGDHAASPHHHAHATGFPWRALAVGVMHGMAGSAALVLLTANAVGSLLAGIAYILLFGFGSIVGMAALSAVIAVPLGTAARRLTWSYNGLQACIGAGTVAFGVVVIVGGAAAWG